jgi:hypothetical protein
MFMDRLFGSKGEPLVAIEPVNIVLTFDQEEVGRAFTHPNADNKGQLIHGRTPEEEIILKAAEGLGKRFQRNKVDPKVAVMEGVARVLELMRQPGIDQTA